MRLAILPESPVLAATASNRRECRIDCVRLHIRRSCLPGAGRLEQVREIYGEQAYEERKRAWERASQPLVPSRFPSHDRPEHRGPERDNGPSH